MKCYASSRRRKDGLKDRETAILYNSKVAKFIANDFLLFFFASSFARERPTVFICTVQPSQCEIGG